MLWQVMKELTIDENQLANVIEYLYTRRAPARACPIIRHINGFTLLSEYAQVVSHVSNPFINFLGAKSRL